MGNMFPKYYNFLVKSLGYNYEKACIELNKIQALSKDELKFWQKRNGKLLDFILIIMNFIKRLLVLFSRCMGRYPNIKKRRFTIL